jgi:hypothetical protein
MCTGKITDLSDVPAETSELGTKWGPSSPIPTEHPEVAAIRAASQANENGETTNFVKAAGERPDLEVERALADEAIKLINSTIGNIDKHRYTLIVYNMGEVDPVTSGGIIEDYSIVATSDTASLVKVTTNEMYKQLNASALEV